MVLASLPELLPHYQVLHQTGDGEINRIQFELGRLKLPHRERYRPVAFLDMSRALAVADLVVGRAGAQTIAEVAVLGKPTVLIPNYQAAAHQQANARVLARAGAARVLDGAKLTPGRLVGEINTILSQEETRVALEKGIREFGRPDAARQLAELVMAAAGERADG
jgi:UDP-N-acetylglucosamine--N-acetylmuramyl-(pentapeptide) pyrophosphoryl-undecaprenol N-acetylglucosamine transferase